ncbi:cellulose biosynthesis cyclic di-GMP-binding regulatory protein BcsB [Vibrio quintilis]|uniref:Cyclic di-GMP-binding protein n=1 Tax=Vibrio quintilis TaxID=1117707 RepID=A0A1M7YYE8_9VIBR|nr:cellulose biosynthesis cyclic di-GMP-binding regulatory protein BcsB [Vibrio quintilis]SHO57506.1 cellulose synthase regulator protein [Vibrio quintilis]
MTRKKIRLPAPDIRLVFMLLVSLLPLRTAAGNLNTFRLSEFHTGDAIMRLAGESAGETLTIPLSPLVEVTSATLRLKLTSSIALQKRRSILSVRLNNATIAQIAFDPEKPDLSADIKLPVSLWRSQYNALTFAVSHHAEICQASQSPDLWSEINLYDSMLTLDTKVKIGQLNLQKLSAFFHPGIGSQQQVKVFTFTQDKAPGLIRTHVLPAIAQALALRREYRSLTFDYQALPEPALPAGNSGTPEQNAAYLHSSWYTGKKQSDELHILTGTRETLAPYLPDTVTRDIKGPFLRIQKTPPVLKGKDILIAPQYRLIVSGLTAAEVLKAATTLNSYHLRCLERTG